MPKTIRISRRSTGRLALGAIAFAIAPHARADDYPSRPVKIISPFGAGGPTDVYTRAIAEELQKALHQPFIIEDHPGAVQWAIARTTATRLRLHRGKLG